MVGKILEGHRKSGWKRNLKESAALGIALLTVSWFFTDVRHVEKINVPADERLATLAGAVDQAKGEQPR